MNGAAACWSDRHNTSRGRRGSVLATHTNFRASASTLFRYAGLGGPWRAPRLHQDRQILVPAVQLHPQAVGEGQAARNQPQVQSSRQLDQHPALRVALLAAVPAGPRDRRATPVPAGGRVRATSGSGPLPTPAAGGGSSSFTSLLSSPSRRRSRPAASSLRHTSLIVCRVTSNEVVDEDDHS